MSIVKLASALLATSVFAFASSTGQGEMDIIPRTVNFLIFAALAYYLLADKVKSFFAGRSETIAKSYEEAENKIKEAKAALEEAKAKRDEAIKLASEFVASAKSDAAIQAKKIAEYADEECGRVQKSAEEEIAMLKKKAIVDVVEETMVAIIEKEGFGVEDKDFAKIIAKRVA